MLGLGIAPLYPLTIGFAIGAAGAEGDAASARFMMAVGVAVISAPVLLGAVADEVGLRSAQLVLPALLAAALSLLCRGQSDAGAKGKGEFLTPIREPDTSATISPVDVNPRRRGTLMHGCPAMLQSVPMPLSAGLT